MKIKTTILFLFAFFSAVAITSWAKPKPRYTTLYIYNQSTNKYVFAWALGTYDETRSGFNFRYSGNIFPGEVGSVTLNDLDAYPDDPFLGNPVTGGQGVFGFWAITLANGVGVDYSLFDRVGIDWDYFEKSDSCSVVITDGDGPYTIVSEIKKHNHAEREAIE